MAGLRASWEVARPERAALLRLERELDELVPDPAGRTLLARLLAVRGVGAEEAAGFLKASLKSSLRPPQLMLDLERAALRLAGAVRAGERVVVYGDYDVDGLAGTAELVLFLRSFGVEPVVYIPDRLEEGYGLNEKVVRKLAQSTPALLITVDCGTQAYDEIALAAELGFDVIVCDHHQPGPTRPPAYALVNPHQPGCRFPFKGLCAAGVVFYLLAATRRHLPGGAGRKAADVRDYLDLVALATIADVAPLKEENRALVKFGLRQIEKRQRPGIAALLDVSRIEVADAEAVAFQLAPRINAAGRIGDPLTALELLTTEDRSRAVMLAAALDRDNQRRRSIEATMTEEAMAKCEALDGWPGRASVVLWSQNWHPGVAGIVAARLAERYGVPAIVVGVEAGVGRGSGRTANGIPLNLALAACSHLCERAGGHEGAVGLTIAAHRIEKFASAFEESVTRLAPATERARGLRAEAEVAGADLGRATIEALELLEPCGAGNPAPVLLTRGLQVVQRRAPAERHLLLALGSARGDRARIDAVGFDMGAALNELGDRVDCIYRPRLEWWRGSCRLKLYLLAIRSSGGREDNVTS